MRASSICCSLLLIAVYMQQQSVEAKPFLFKFFLPQAPARDSSSSSTSSSSSITTSIDFSNIISTKLNLLARFLQSSFSNSISTGLNIGLRKIFQNTQSTTTRRPYTSTTNTTPDIEFEPESTTSFSTSSNSGVSTTTSTESPSDDNSTGSANSSGIMNNDLESSNREISISMVTTTTEESNNNNFSSKVTTNRYESSYDSSQKNDNSGSETKFDSKIIATDNSNKITTSGNRGQNYNSTSEVTTDKTNNGYYYTTTEVTFKKNSETGPKVTAEKSQPTVSSDKGGDKDYISVRVTTYKPNGSKYSSSQDDYIYGDFGNAMSENEISNEVDMMGRQYFSTF